MNCPHHKPSGLIGIAPDPSASIIVNGLRPGLPILPQRMAKLPLDSRGYPVPWFVEWIDGKPDFRVMNGDKFLKAIRFKLCWCCGEPLGAHKVFVAGPMCGINRTSAEPPNHRECAEFAAKACPFLTIPKMKRNDRNLPEADKPAGTMIERNPGVTMLRTTKSFRPFEADGGVLIEMGAPESVEWFCQGRTATRDEVITSVESGLPALEKIAMEYGEHEALKKACAAFLPYLPPEQEGAENVAG